MSKIIGVTVGTPTPRSNYNQPDPKKADYLIGREKIVDKGDVVGGAMAFKILKVEKINDNETNITLDSVEGLQPGYLCSIDCGNNYNGFANILGIIPEANVVAVNKYPDGSTVEEDSVFWIPDHPELGTTKIGEGAYNLGVNCKANQKGAISTGEDNISDGKRSFTTNRGNYAGYLGAGFGSYNKIFSHNGLGGGNLNILYEEAVNALLMGYMNQFRAPNGIGAGRFNWGLGENICVTGEHNTAGAKNDFVGGAYSESYFERCLLFGLHLLSGRVGQTIFGDFNAPNDRDILQIGCGTDEKHRANAFIVDKNRNAIGGTNNQILDIANKFNVLLYGDNLWAQNNGETALGRYNISTPQTVYTVGIGTADNARKNGLAVEKDGRVIIGADPVYGMDATTKQYVDKAIKDAGGSKIEHTSLPMKTPANNMTLDGTWHVYHNTENDTYDIYGYADISYGVSALELGGQLSAYTATLPFELPAGLSETFYRKHYTSIEGKMVPVGGGSIFGQNYTPSVSGSVNLFTIQYSSICARADATATQIKGKINVHFHVEAE